MTITVSGRPAAVLGPADRRSWRSPEEIAALFAHGGADRGWQDERDLLDGAVRDPWVDR